MVGFCENCNETLGSVKGSEHLLTDRMDSESQVHYGMSLVKLLTHLSCNMAE